MAYFSAFIQLGHWLAGYRCRRKPVNLRAAFVSVFAGTRVHRAIRGLHGRR